MAKSVRVSKKTLISARHVDSLTQDLAKAAGLSSQEARRVLKVFHLDKLVRNANATQRLLSSPGATAALGLSGTAVSAKFDAASAASFSLKNLRLAVRVSAAAGIVV